ncbi:DUF3079 domain-containing protein [Undibacterium squillarum]|uniref:DUF3079 domain-containing protein n=1 Tax=Undibacterium squillarum TaxID=1131567 RepID=UPI0035B1C39E
MVNKKTFPVRPAHPERICWGCDLYCKVGEMRCGNGAERTQHPCETWGDDWAETALDSDNTATPAPSGQNSES